MRLMQQTCHYQAKHSALLFLMKGSPTHENYACERGQRRSGPRFLGEKSCPVQSQMYNRDLARTPTLTYFPAYKMPKDLTRGAQPAPIGPTIEPRPLFPMPSTICTQNSLSTVHQPFNHPTNSQVKINQQSGKPSGHLWARIFLLIWKCCF